MAPTRRQGNQNSEVQVLRYVTERSFDAYMWQTVTRKAKFIGQVMRGRLDVREIEDLGEAALSYDEVKALATGNPLLLDQAKAQAEVTRLERLERAHGRNQDALRFTIASHARRIENLERRAVACEAVAAEFARSKGWHRDVDGEVFDKPGEANVALRDVLGYSREGRVLGELNGHSIVVASRDYRSITIALDCVPESEVNIVVAELEHSAPMTRLENKLEGAGRVGEMARTEIERLKHEAKRAEEDFGAPFRFGSRLKTERARLMSIEEILERDAAPAPVAAAQGIPSEGLEPEAGGLAVSGLTRIHAEEVAPVLESHVPLEILARVACEEDEECRAAVQELRAMRAGLSEATPAAQTRAMAQFSRIQAEQALAKKIGGELALTPSISRWPGLSVHERAEACEQRLARMHASWLKCRSELPTREVLDARLGQGPGAAIWAGFRDAWAAALDAGLELAKHHGLEESQSRGR